MSKRHTIRIVDIGTATIDVHLRTGLSAELWPTMSYHPDDCGIEIAHEEGLRLASFVGRTGRLQIVFEGTDELVAPIPRGCASRRAAGVAGLRTARRIDRAGYTSSTAAHRGTADD